MTGRGDQTEHASWWPKHSVWVRGSGYTGIWSADDERWFQRRLEKILDGSEGTLNVGEWKHKLRRQKKAGALAEVVDARSWHLLYKNLIAKQV